MRVLGAIVTAGLLVACKQDPPTAATAPFAREQALEVALTLAYTRGITDEPPRTDREWIERYRLECQVGCVLLRRYRVGATPSPTTITRDELVHVLLTEPAADGTVVELFDRSPFFGTLLAALLDPAADLARRTEALTGAPEAELYAQLRDRLQIDIARRAIAGFAWTDARGDDAPWTATVVDTVRHRATEIALADAQRLQPTAALKQQLAVRSGIGRWTPSAPLHPRAPVVITAYPDDFAAIRTLVTPMPTSPALARLVAQPIYPLYAEPHGVGFIEVPARDVTTLWKQLDAEAAHTGMRPIFFPGDAQELIDARLAWRWLDEPGTTPASVLAAATTTDLATVLAPGTPAPARGPWPTTTPARVWAFPVALGLDEPRHFLLLVPTDAAWKSAAYLPAFLQTGTRGRTLAELAAVSRRWEQTYGARLATLAPGLVQWYPTRPLSRQTATTFALELHAFATPGAETTVEDTAAALTVSTPLTASWD